MIYPENTKNIPLIINWITSALSRAIVQKQEPYLDFINIRNPCLVDPFSLDPESYAIELPDGYIIPLFSGNEEYETSIERNYMASEGVTNLQYGLVSLSYKTHQNDAQVALNQLHFFQTLYTWGTELIWVDKVHPQDIVGNILFNGTTPVYAKRLPAVGSISPDNFLQSVNNYDFSFWSNNTSIYANFSQNQCVWGNNQLKFYYPGMGFQWSTQDILLKKDVTANSIAQVINSYLITELGTDTSTFLNQNWEARVSILSAAAVNYTPYLSYIVRNLNT